MNESDVEERKEKRPDFILIDATNMILGRLGARVAKMLLEGQRVVIINAEKAVISGDPKYVIDKYKDIWDIHSRTNPRRGPFHYSRPDLFVKRTIRGMLPWKKPRGREAYKRLRVYLGVPPEYRNLKPLRFEEIDATKRLKHKWIYVGDLLKHLGWKGIVKY
ncbi:MAG: 50S ribosomal protein L13 [Candidatus Njordarchaeales archaeon]